MIFKPSPAAAAKKATKLTSKQFRLKLPTSLFFRITYSANYIGHMLRSHYIYEKTGSILILKAELDDAARPRVGLWWNVTVPAHLSKPTVRNWTRRRVRDAFARALWERGWDRDGIVRSDTLAVGAAAAGDKDGGEVVPLVERNLKATLALNITPAAITAKPDELLKASRQLVSGLERLS